MLNKFNILLIGDEPDNRQLLTIALQMAGYIVHVATDGQEGLSAIEKHHPDLIIANARMPNMDGYEMTKRIRSNLQTRFIPVIIQSTSTNDFDNERRATQVGALGYISDPDDLDLLLARTRLFLDWRNYIDSLQVMYSQAKEHAQNSKPELKAESSNLTEHDHELLESLNEKIKDGRFDVFLCHNNEDKDSVKEIAKKLHKQGILPWLDEWALRPGFPWQEILEQQISQIKSAAVFVGKNGIGPWQRNELNAFLREFVSRGCPVIPVLLSDAHQKPELPIFLKGMTWVDFRKQEPDPMIRLLWGITGKSSWPMI